MKEKKPLFIESSTGNRIIMRVCVAANLSLICYCLIWLCMNWQKAVPSPLALFIIILAGYFLADVISGLIHWTTDTWFFEEKIGRAMSILREHHSHPQHVLEYGFLEHASLGSAPAALIIGPIAIGIAQFPLSELSFAGMLLCVEQAVCLVFLSSFHNLGHRYSKYKVIRFAQQHQFLMSPKYHAVHHRTLTERYCAINGWANHVFDRCLIWRWLERIIQHRTGAIPRKDDEDWQRRFRRRPL